MTVRNAAGTIQTKTSVMSSMTEITPDENLLYRFDGAAELYEATTTPGRSTVEGNRQLAFVPNGHYTKGEIDRLFPAPTLLSISPESSAGGATQDVVINGDHFTGVTAITVGGTAATGVTVVNENQITATFPNKAAGTYDVVMTDDSGSTTFTGAYIYT